MTKHRQQRIRVRAKGEIQSEDRFVLLYKFGGIGEWQSDLT